MINSLNISSVQETFDSEYMYSVGIHNGNNNKIDMSFISRDLNRFSEKIKMPDVFDENKNYFEGDYVTYNGKAYVFISSHISRPWDVNDVRKFDTGYFTFSTVDDYYTITVALTSDSNFFDGFHHLVSLENIESGKIDYIYTDTYGKCKINVIKDNEYILNTEDIDGFEKSSKINYINSSYDLQENVYYIKFNPKSENCNISFNLKTEDNINSYVSSKPLYILNEDDKYSANGTTDANGNITFSLPKNKLYSVRMPVIDTIQTQSEINIISDREKTIDFSYPIDIYYVDASDFKEYKIDDYPFNQDGSYDPINHPCTSLHVATKSLKYYGFDYYVRLIDLTTQRASSQTPVAAKQWCTSYGTLHPNVTTSTSTTVAAAYDGPTMTDAMISDSVNMGQTSPAALYAKTLTYTHKGITYNGYMGTQVQMNPLFIHSPSIYAALTKFGYTGNYKTGTHWWSSTQNNAYNAWGWVSGGYWNNGGKTGSYYVLPFFAIR